MASTWEKYKDLDIDEIDDYYGGSDSYKASDTGELVIDTRSLEKDTSGLKKVGSYQDAKSYFAALEKAIKQLATNSMNRNFARLVPDILDGYVRYNQDLIGYNDYSGGLIHAYYARLFVGGRQVLLRRVSDKISIWGKVKQNKHGKDIFRLMRRRHAIKRKYTGGRWHNMPFGKTTDMPKFDSAGNRLTWMGRPLNWRGRRLKGKHGGHFRYRTFIHSIYKDAEGKVRAHRIGGTQYDYAYFYGHKKGQKTYPNPGITDFRRKGSMSPYLKKEFSRNPHIKEIKKGAYRYVNRRIDRMAPGGFKKMVLAPFQSKPRARTTLEIFNAAPYSRRVARLGYTVLPALKVRDGYSKQIATMMKKDFDRFFK